MATVPAMTMFDFEKVKVNGIITPKDGTVRSNLNVDVLLGYNTSLGDNILATTTTDGNGGYNLEFFIPSGSYMHVPMICCGDNKKAVFDVTQDSSSQTVLQVIETDLTITSTKDILSFEDNEVATINATLTYGTIPQPIEGEEISFVVKDSQNNIIDTQVSMTDSNGIASIVYESQGIGDVTISASIGGFVSKTYSIYDYWQYSTSIPSYSSQSLGSNYYKYNFNNPITLPSKFKMTFKGKFTSIYNVMLTAMIGESTSDYYYSGFDRDGLLHCISRNNSRAVLTRENTGKSVNTEYTITITFDGTEMVLSDGTHTLSSSNSEYDKEKWVGLLIGEQQTFSLFQIEQL